MHTTDIGNIKLYLIGDWQRLTGQFVEVWLGNRIYRQGFVDMVMPDGTGIWLTADAGHSRQYLEKAEGYSLWSDDFRCAT